MGFVLFEATYSPSKFLIVSALLLLFFVGLAVLTRLRPALFQNPRTHPQYPFIFSLVGAGMCAMTLLLAIAVEVVSYHAVVGAYQQGKYQIVEGYVEGFDPQERGSKSPESFEINGVAFSYSEYHETYGYHTPRDRGGVIRGDGQYLRIGYVSSALDGENTIVFIEQIPDPNKKAP
ncbi:MAG: hypothetical protein IJW22_09085 [Clostridia bacterium]|nr:hypothetical protein [Clostridia bacterium]